MGSKKQEIGKRGKAQPKHTMNGHLFPSEQQLCTAKILIIDDEMADIRMLEWALKKAQYSDFRSLTDPTRAQTEFEQFQPDLVLLDLQMPKLDGFAVLAQLRKSAPAGEFLPVLVITGENTAGDAEPGIGGRGQRFLGKPIDYSESCCGSEICCNPVSVTGGRGKSRHNWKLSPLQRKTKPNPPGKIS